MPVVMSGRNRLHLARQQMTPENPDQPAPWKGLLGAIALSWLPLALYLGLSARKDMEEHAVGAAAMGVLAVIFAFLIFRKHAWSAILWVPLIVFAAFQGVFMLGGAFSTPTSGPNAGPLEGVAVLLMLLVGAGLAVIVLVGSWLRPKTWSPAMLVIGGLNAALMVPAGSSGYRATTGQEIILQLRDPSGRAVTGASVKYLRFGYGNGGEHVFDESGGPIFSDEQGVAKLPSRRMLYETKITVSKVGFRDVSVEIEMQFSEHDKTRRFVLSTHDTRAIASGSVPATDPVRFSLYLSPDSDAPSPEVRHFGLYSKNDLARELTPKSLDLETGRFTADLSGDLELEYFSATMTRYRDERLRVRGLNGVQLCLVSHNLSLSSPESPYTHLYRIAPESGYQPEIIIENPGNSPGPVVYLRASDGKLHGRLCLEALGDGVDETPRYNGTLEINPSGRNLEWVKKND